MTVRAVASLSLPCRIAVATVLGACGSDLTLPSDGTPARLVVVAGDDQRGDPGDELPTPLTVAVVDASNRPVPGIEVAFRFADEIDGAGVAPGVTTTDEEGRAAARVVLGEEPGPQEVEALILRRDGDELRVAFTLTALTPPAPPRQDPGSGSGSGGGGSGSDDDEGDDEKDEKEDEDDKDEDEDEDEKKRGRGR